MALPLMVSLLQKPTTRIPPPPPLPQTIFFFDSTASGKHLHSGSQRCLVLVWVGALELVDNLEQVLDRCARLLLVQHALNGLAVVLQQPLQGSQ